MQRLTGPYFSIPIVVICGGLLFFQACTKSTRQSERVAPSSAREEETSVAGHNWDSISYPKLPTSPPGLPKPALSIRRNDDGLILHIEYSAPEPEDGREKGLPSRDQLTARMHLASGKVIDSIPDELNGQPDLAYKNDIIYPYSFRFPWGPNVLEEAWIELRIQTGVYWIEVPYGFIRNPDDSLALDKPKNGEPAIAPAMAKLDENAKLIPWVAVHYSLGSTQNGDLYSIAFSNPFSAEAELHLYRSPADLGESSYRWELHSPRTSVSIKDSDGGTVESRGIGIRLPEEGYLRRDTFKFNTYGGSDERTWGTAIIKSDDESFELIVPSSLFKYIHGVAEPDNQARIPRQADGQ